jgi:hypothetical protein
MCWPLYITGVRTTGAPQAPGGARHAVVHCVELNKKAVQDGISLVRLHEKDTRQQLLGSRIHLTHKHSDQLQDQEIINMVAGAKRVYIVSETLGHAAGMEGGCAGMLNLITRAQALGKTVNGAAFSVVAIPALAATCALPVMVDDVHHMERLGPSMYTASRFNFGAKALSEEVCVPHCVGPKVNDMSLICTGDGGL